MTDNIIELAGNKITVGSESDFFINEDNVDGELCEVGKLLCFYGNLAAELKAQAAVSKANMESLHAELSLDVRKDAKEKGIKVTEGGIKEQVLTNQQYKQAQKTYFEHERDYQKVENFFRSQNKKADCVISLAYKQRAEINKF